jgi:predicted permease
METLWLDLRYSFRTLGKSPAFLVVAVLSLALGIGMNTAIFTVVKAVFFQPLPFKEQHRLVTMTTADGQIPGYLPTSYPNLVDYRDRQQVFSSVAVTSFVALSASRSSSTPETWSGEIVSASFFETLGASAALGRVFGPSEADDQPPAPVAVISNGAWVERFGAGPDIVGRTISINRRTFTIIGVMPPGFKGLNTLTEPTAWVPMSTAPWILARPDIIKDRLSFSFYAVARLKNGVTREQAEASLQPISKQLAADYPQSNRGRTIRLTTVSQAVINARYQSVIEQASIILMTVVALVLLIACANVAALLLVRARARSKEFAVRLAVGAGTGRIARQLLTESVLLSLVGGAAGLLVARWGRDLLWRFRPPWVGGSALDLTLDKGVLLFALSVSLLTGLLFGMVPVIGAWRRRDLATELKERTSQGVYEHRIFGMRGLLVIGQCALSVVALVGAVLFIESLRRVQNSDPGFDAHHLATMRLSASTNGLGPAQALQFYQNASDRISTLPSVQAASFSTISPLGGGLGGMQRSIHAEGFDATPQGTLVITNFVGPRYFETLRQRILNGRDFAISDTAGAQPVAVVNEALAQRFWPGQDAIGKRLSFTVDPTARVVVGVVADAKMFSLTDDKAACVYVPLLQTFMPQVSLLVRTDGDPVRVLGGMRTELQRLDRNVPIGASLTLTELINRSLWAQRLIAGLLAAFGVLALMLAAVGVYGLTAYSVSQKTNEIGIRMALGAKPGDVVRNIVSQGMMLVVPGLIIGSALSLAAGRLASSLLFGITSAHFPAYLMAALILTVVALFACYMPARRATKVDPVLALRHE